MSSLWKHCILSLSEYTVFLSLSQQNGKTKGDASIGQKAYKSKRIIFKHFL